jgi:hypothetical protein
MSVDLILDLFQKYKALENANASFSKAVVSDNHLPILLPGSASEPNRDTAARFMTQLFLAESGDNLPQSGLICASPYTIQMGEQLNVCKGEFQASVKSFRDSVQGEKSRLDKLIDRVLLQQCSNARHRVEELQLALKRAQLNRLDLLRCYAKIRVLPKDLVSISWTWARTHAVIDPITRDEAIKQAHNLSNEETRNIALNRLAALPQGEKLAYRKKLPNQLRANLQYLDDGQLKRKAVTISGIVLSQDCSLPKTWVWRDDPGEQNPKAPLSRVTRIDTKIDREPYIKALHLHLYKENVYNRKCS